MTDFDFRVFEMVRTYKRKSERGAYGDDALKEALAALQNQPMKAVSRQFGIPARTLRQHRDKKVTTVGSLRLGPRQPVLTTDVEVTLREHVAYMERCLYGLTTKDVRRLAYDLAVKLDRPHMFSDETKMAGRDWLYGFFRRHPDLAIRRNLKAPTLREPSGSTGPKCSSSSSSTGTSYRLPTIHPAGSGTWMRRV